MNISAKIDCNSILGCMLIVLLMLFLLVFSIYYPQIMDIVDPNPITVENIIDDPAPDPSFEEDLRSDHDPFKDTLKLN